MNRNQTITLVAITLIVISSGIYSRSLSQQQNSREVTPGGVGALNDEQQQEPSEAVCVLPNGQEIYDSRRCEEVKTYRSQKLGIEFQVVNSAKILEEGNRVYVSSLDTGNIKDGQYVEILPKSQSETPIETVNRLSGPTYPKCRITLSQDSTYPNNVSDDGGRIEYPKSYSIIDSYRNEKDWDLVTDDKEPLCQSQYAGLNGMMMFIADSENPTKIAFFGIGQYSEPAGPQRDWYHTFRFIK